MEFGKILVFLHLGLSVTLAALALGVYTDRIALNRTGAKGMGPKDALTAGENRMKAVGPEIRTFEAKVREQRTILKAHEDQREKERPWYATQLKHLRTEATLEDDKFAFQVDRDPIGRPIKGGDKAVYQLGPILNGENPPQPLQDRGGKPIKLASEKYYFDQIKEQLTAIDREIKLLKTEEQRTSSAVMELGPEKIMFRENAEEAKRNKVKDEYKSIQPKWLNDEVDLENLVQLKKRLHERILELRDLKETRAE